MPSVNPDCYHLSASSIASFKACPQRFRLQYREGLRPAEDTDSQRVGTHWHAMHETYAEAKQHSEMKGSLPPDHDPATDAINAVVALLNEKYQTPPSYKTPQEFALERTVLLMSFIGYLWYYQNDPIEFLANELPFELPLHEPRTGLPLPLKEVVRVGKIDHVIRWQGGVGALERKSTSRSIAADSDYWDKSKKDTQVSMYALAFRDMVDSGNLPDSVYMVLYGNDEQRAEGQTIQAASRGSSGPQQSLCDAADEAGKATDILCNAKRMPGLQGEEEALSSISSPQSRDKGVPDRDEQGSAESTPNVAGNSEVRRAVCQLPLVSARPAVRYGGTMYDVWHKPTIKPAMLTQAETKAFIESGTYCGQKFEVEAFETPVDDDRASQQWVNVNEESAQVEMGKKGFAIRETVEMFGARLLADIYERPDFYFVRREIARTDIEIKQFRQQLFAVYSAQKSYAKSGCWFENEQQCRATYACSYIPICYGPGADAVCDGKTTPPGFKRIFVDLTVNGNEVED